MIEITPLFLDGYPGRNQEVVITAIRKSDEETESLYAG